MRLGCSLYTSYFICLLYLSWAAASLQLLHLLADLGLFLQFLRVLGEVQVQLHGEGIIHYHFLLVTMWLLFVVRDGERQMGPSLCSGLILVTSHFFLSNFTCNYWPREVQWFQALTRFRSKTCHRILPHRQQLHIGAFTIISPLFYITYSLWLWFLNRILLI